jgi:endogenous inhibitor of DNA gyrase (YacG/DUF329 family)
MEMDCPECGARFDVELNRVYRNPLVDLVSLSPSRVGRAQKNLWKWGYHERTFDKVTCPQCGCVSANPNLRAYGFIRTKRGVQTLDLVVLVAILVLAILYA